MEGVGARLGRSSSRYGTTTVFTGPVRKWKKNWVPILPPPSSSSSNTNNLHNNNHLSNINNSNGSTNSVSHLRLYKWTPLSKYNSTSNAKSIKINSGDSPTDNGSPSKDDDDDDLVPQEPPRRKFKFVPIAVLEERKKENEENSGDEAKPIDADEDNEDQVSKGDDIDEKPDINDVPMDDNQESEENHIKPGRQDLNELDLSLGLTSQEDEPDSDSKIHLNEDSRP